MLTTNTYIKETFKLVKSLVIKLSDVAMQINRELVNVYGLSVVDLNDKHTWKYYLNISGEYHPLDDPIKVYVKAIESEETLTKSLLLQYPTLQEELSTLDFTYNNLIKAYPTQESLIKGIINPVNIDTAIDSDDGTVLAYNSNYIDDRELSILDDIESHDKSYLLRWNINEYSVIDNLYLSALLADMYSSILLKIFNLRLNNVFTYEVSNYHMDNFFKSTLGLGDEISILTNESKLWLYNNLRLVKKNIGKDSTLELIIDNLISANGVGIGEYSLGKKPIATPTVTDIHSPAYVDEDMQLTTIPRNDIYANSSSVKMKLNTLVSKELLDNDVGDLLNSEEYFTGRVLEELTNTNTYSVPTKVLDLVYASSFNLHHVPLATMLVDNWFKLAMNNEYIGSYDFKDPINFKEYSLTPKQGVLYLIKLIFASTTTPNGVIDSYSPRTVLNNNVTSTDLVINMFSGTDMTLVADALIAAKPAPGPYDSIESITTFFKELNRFYELSWRIGSNTDNLLISSNIKVLESRMLDQTYVDFKVGGVALPIDDLLAIEGLYLDFATGYNYISGIRALLSLFTGTVFNDAVIAEFAKNFLTIIKKLTSYSVQPISNTSDSTVIVSPYNGITVLSSSAVAYGNSETEFTHYEDIELGLLDSRGNNLNTEIRSINLGPVISCADYTDGAIGFECNLFDNHKIELFAVGHGDGRAPDINVINLGVNINCTDDSVNGSTCNITDDQ